MSDQEKVDLVSGDGLWRTSRNHRLEIPETIMTDGTHGVRYDPTQIERSGAEKTALQQFLKLVSKPSHPGDLDDQFADSVPMTCFPSSSAAACSWNRDLLYRTGAALAAECLGLGVNLLLAPGINIRRTPLAGRSYEYYSEDPVVSGELAAAVIQGLQDRGVGASLKHFACHNSEYMRTTMSSDVDERALREIYLAGFERAIRKSAPWTVMSSYNRINGEQVSQSHSLLTGILRDEWGYEGLVVSDWFAIKDRPASLMAGNDLDMPESPVRKKGLLDALASGRVTPERLDEACLRVLQYVRRVKAVESDAPISGQGLHHELAREIAIESIVLLKNSDGALPLRPSRDRKVLVVGPGAMAPIIQGAGSAAVRPARIDIPFESLKEILDGSADLTFCIGVEPDEPENTLPQDEAVAHAEDCDVVVVFANCTTNADGEWADRRHLGLAEGFDSLITDMARTDARVVVVLACPDAVETPWADDVDAIVVTFFPGEGGGHALAKILTGEVSPCGKLTTTFPTRVQDVPGFHTYPGENGHHFYSEGLFAGYRFYDKREVMPAFPFGHGLSYTQFEYGRLDCDRNCVEPGVSVTVRFPLTNTGRLFGKEIVQLYVRPVGPGLMRPVRELKDFRKVALSPGEGSTVSFTLSTRDFQYYDPAVQDWVLRSDAFVIEVAASSSDIRQSVMIDCISDPLTFPKLETSTVFSLAISNPVVHEMLVEFLSQKLGIDDENSRQLLEKLKGSFLGFADTLSWFVGSDIDEAEVRCLLERINSRFRHSE